MILITRPFEDAKETSRTLKKQNYNCFIEPLLEIEYLEPDLSEYDEDDFQSFIATSKHAKVFVQEEEPLASLPEQGKDGAELLEWIEENLSPDEGKLIYLRGEQISVDIAGILAGKGFDIDEIIVYKTHKPDAFSERLIRNLSKISFATFYSRQTLANFLELVKKHQSDISHLQAIVISEKVEKLAKTAGFANIFVAAEPDAPSMLRKIREVCKP